MRIIAGHHKGRRIRIPKNLPVRPTTDRAKEALFSILNHKIDFESTNVLDLYSGTGSIGFEFCSRGCPSVTSVDANQACASFVENTAKDLDLPIRSIRMTAKNYLSKCVSDFDVIFV
ncbi:MAG: RsmD family RNA methyltransferase, partial [Flavobacteriaceae bacterium]